MIKIIFCIVLILINTNNAHAFGTGAGTCDVVADFSTITAMGTRTRNQTPGDYQLSSDSSDYNVFEHVEITMTANGSGDQSTFTGIVVSVVDEMGNKVGTFNFDDETEVRNCDGSAMMAATHTASHGSTNSRTLFWVPPSELVGNVYVLAYVLSGVRNNQSTQQFYRMVRGDGAITLTESNDPIFINSFE